MVTDLGVTPDVRLYAPPAHKMAMTRHRQHHSLLFIIIFYTRSNTTHAYNICIHRKHMPDVDPAVYTSYNGYMRKNGIVSHR